MSYDFESDPLYPDYVRYVSRIRKEYEDGYWKGTHSNWMTMARSPWKSFADWKAERERDK